MAKVMSLLNLAENAPKCNFGVRAQTDMKIWCVEGVHLLKVVSSENLLEIKG